MYGPNYHEFMLKVKEAFDPLWICHPPVPLAHDEFVRRAPWLKSMVDWESPKKLPMPKW
jgi:hypothetical protein